MPKMFVALVGRQRGGLHSFEKMRWAGTIVLATACDAVWGINQVSPGTPPADAQVCPSSYSFVAGSYYRFIAVPAPPRALFDECESDQIGTTHLVALDRTTEYDAVEEFSETQLGGPTSVLIGGVQRLGEPRPGDGWLSITGGALVAFWQGDQPNDGGGPEAGREQLVVLTSGHNLFDVGSASDQRAVCECDQKPVDETFRAIFSQVTH